MKATYLQLASALALTFGIAACVPSTPAPAPTSAPVASPRPAPPAPAPAFAAAPLTSDWQDAPLSAGWWFYESDGATSRAAFSDNRFKAPLVIACDRQRGHVGIAIANTRPGSPVIQIQTETAQRQIPSAVEPSVNGIAAILDPHDPILDAMALSKGRFGVAVEGGPAMIVPSHAEVSRVIEDCR